MSWGRLEEAAVHLQLCEKILTSIENEHESAVIAGHLGNVYLSRGDPIEALKHFEREKRLQSEVAGAAHSRAYTHRNFARAYRNLGHHQDATQNYLLAVKIFREFANLVQQGLTLIELCRHRLRIGSVADAISDLAEAQQCFETADRSKGFEPMVNAVQAQIAWVQGDRAGAARLFSSSIRRMEAVPPSYFLGETYLYYGRLCVELYKHEKQAHNMAAASEHYQEAKLAFDKGIKCATSQSLGYLLEHLRQEVEGLDQREFVKLVLSRFVNPESLDRLFDKSFNELNSFQVEERTVIFVDLSGYTAMVEKESLVEVRDILNEFYGFATRIIHYHGGVIDKFIGDCVMAIFKGGTTVKGLQNQAVAAVVSALSIIEEVEHLSERRFAGTKRKLAASAGICTGDLFIGLVGSLQKMNYTCIGDVVNVAARLQGLAKPGEVLISHETYLACMQGGAVIWSQGHMQEAYVKNREQPVRYWSLGREARNPLRTFKR